MFTCTTSHVTSISYFPSWNSGSEGRGRWKRTQGLSEDMENPQTWHLVSSPHLPRPVTRQEEPPQHSHKRQGGSPASPIPQVDTITTHHLTVLGVSQRWSNSSHCREVFIYFSFILAVRCLGFFFFLSSQPLAGFCALLATSVVYQEGRGTTDKSLTPTLTSIRPIKIRQLRWWWL